MIRKKPKLKIGRLAEKRRKRRIIKTSLYLTFALTFILGLSYFSFADFMSIDKVEVKGLESLKEEEIMSVFESRTEGRIFGLFSKSNAYLYPKSEIKSEILKSNNKILEVDIKKVNFADVLISIKERKPYAIWCQEVEPKVGEFISEEEEGVSEYLEQGTQEVTIQINDLEATIDEGTLIHPDLDLTTAQEEDCFYLDDEGFIFGEADDEYVRTLIKYYGNFSDKALGDYLLDPELFLSLRGFTDSLSTFFSVIILSLKLDSDNIFISLENGTSIIINIKEDHEKTFGNLVIFAGDPEYQINNDEYGVLENFDHIDLRFGNKILYKLKTS